MLHLTKELTQRLFDAGHGYEFYAGECFSVEAMRILFGQHKALKS